MADNIAVTPGTGSTVAADDVGGVLHQRVKMSLGADGSATDAVGGAGAVSAAVQRVTLASDDPAVTQIGATNETAPATDTATVGLNGRLQRVAQRLTSLIALLPSSIGSKAAASSLGVALATDQVGTAGSPATPVLSVQGVSGGTDQPVRTPVINSVAVTPTLAASSHSSGTVLGTGAGATGALKFASVFRSGVNSGVVQSITVNATTVITAALTLHLFRDDPSATTWTDTGAPSINASDIDKYVGSYTLSNNNSQLGTVTNYTLDGVGKAIVATGQDLYGVLVAGATFTPASNGLTVRINAIPD